MRLSFPRFDSGWVSAAQNPNPAVQKVITPAAFGIWKRRGAGNFNDNVISLLINNQSTPRQDIEDWVKFVEKEGNKYWLSDHLFAHAKNHLNRYGMFKNWDRGEPVGRRTLPRHHRGG